MGTIRHASPVTHRLCSLCQWQLEQFPDEQLPQPEELPVPTKRSVPLKANLDIFFSRFSFLHSGQQTESLDLKTIVSKS